MTPINKVHDAIMTLKQYHAERIEELQKMELMIDPERSLYPLKQRIEDASGIYDLSTKSRKMQHAWARYIFFHLARKDGHTLTLIATISKRDHSTVIHGIKKYEELYKHDHEFSLMADSVISKIQANEES